MLIALLLQSKDRKLKVLKWLAQKTLNYETAYQS